MAVERHPTLVDVARVAKVATSTASRALQESPRISETTKLRVRAAARGLGYRPNRIAQSLRTSTANFVGIVVPDIGVAFYSRVVKGAQDVLERAGHQVLMMNTERESEREAAALRTLLEHRVSGILLATSGGAVRSRASRPSSSTTSCATAASPTSRARMPPGSRCSSSTSPATATRGSPTSAARPTFTSGRERLDGFREAVRAARARRPRAYVELGDAVWSAAERRRRDAATDRARRAADGGRHLRRHARRSAR